MNECKGQLLSHNAVQIHACKGDNLYIGFGRENYEFTTRAFPFLGRGPGVLCAGFLA